MTLVEREFASPSEKVLASFEVPYLAPGGEYRCRWRIVWPNHESSFELAGIDGVQALMLAMRSAHSELTESDDYKAGTLTYLDQLDLDLQPDWGTGPLYDAGSPPADLDDR